MSKMGEELRKACKDHVPFSNSKKHRILNGFPRQSTVNNEFYLSILISFN